MFLHIGSGILCDTSEIIAIFDLDNLTSGVQGAAFLKICEKEENCIFIGGDFDLPKSIILTDQYTYISPITSQTLLRRSRLSQDSFFSDNDLERQNES